MLRTITANLVWALVWTHCCPEVSGQYEYPRVQKIDGAVFLRCPLSANEQCQEQCSTPAGGACWPSTAVELRDDDISRTCRDTVRNDNRIFTSETIYCTINQDMRYECRVNLMTNERTVFLGVKVASSGGIGGYTMLNGDHRRAYNSTSLFSMATLLTPGYSPLDNRNNESFPFNVYVFCRNRLDHCHVQHVRMLVVRYRCA